MRRAKSYVSWYVGIHIFLDNFLKITEISEKLCQKY